MIVVGSTNQIKIDAVKEVICDFPSLAQLDIRSLSVPSGISEQPLSLPEIIQGAKNRALGAFQSCKNYLFSFGIESGLFEAPGTQTGYLEACICCIFDGKNCFTGLSCGFEVPPRILHSVIANKWDLSQACHYSGITKNPKLGSAEGLIGILTKGRIDRKNYTKQAVITALLQIENKELYSHIDPRDTIIKEA